MDEERVKLARKVKSKTNRICALMRYNSKLEKKVIALKGCNTKLRNELDELKKQHAMSRKAWLKMIAEIDDPYFCESLINQLEAQKRKLSKGEFESETPRG
jgi:predicted RNase H-like nuclease (RuvC/YqgF family)